jgi:superfamily II DNA or RNA helicase
VPAPNLVKLDRVSPGSASSDLVGGFELFDPAPASPSPVEAGRPLRAWQRDALQAYENQQRQAGAGTSDFLVTATPGAGKTTFALTLAVRLLQRRVVDRLIVVAPTDHLRTQWAEAADRLGVVLDPNLPNSVGPVRAGTTGYVTTYAQVAGKPMLHAARATARRTLVILDEVHHAGDGLSWGEAVFEAFRRAARRLCLTGTPFRTRVDERIPFVRYLDDGEGNLASTADYSYGYREALADGVVRPVVFAAYTGTSRWRNSAGEVVAASLTEAGTRSTEAAAWKTALDPRGQWVPHVLAAMDERITQLRASGIPDAAGLVLASDQDDARAYAKIVESVTGEVPEVILSDDPKASAKIASFTTSSRRMAVCVRMVSEGVDVPRAACLAWMTSYRTPLFFAQAVGRVVRARNPRESATVFLPAVRPLLALAAELETDRNHVLPPPKASSEDLDPLPPPERDEAGVGQWEALDADAEFAHVLHGGRAVVADPAGPNPLSDDQEDLLGLPGLLTPEQTAALLARQDSDLRRRISSVRDAPVKPDDSTSWRAAADLRREVNRLVGQVAARRGMLHAVVHAKLRAEVPGPPSASASADVLAARRDHLMGML